MAALVTNVQNILRALSVKRKVGQVCKKPKISQGTISNVRYSFSHESNTFEETVTRIQPKLKQTINSDAMVKIEGMIEKWADGYSCTNCGYISKHQSHMKEHVEKHIGGLEYPCNSCNKVFRSSHSFTVHKSRCVYELTD